MWGDWVGNGVMHPVQEHINTLGSIARYNGQLNITYREEGTVFQPRVLQLNLDNINRLPHGKYPDRKKSGIYQHGTRTHDLLLLWSDFFFFKICFDLSQVAWVWYLVTGASQESAPKGLKEEKNKEIWGIFMQQSYWNWHLAAFLSSLRITYSMLCKGLYDDFSTKQCQLQELCPLTPTKGLCPLNPCQVAVPLDPEVALPSPNNLPLFHPCLANIGLCLARMFLTHRIVQVTCHLKNVLGTIWNKCAFKDILPDFV